MSCIRQLGNSSDQRATWSLYTYRQKARRCNAASMATRPVSGLGRYVPRHIRIESRDCMQQRGWLCRCNSRDEENSKIQRHHSWCWLCASGYRDVGRVGETSSWPHQRNWSSNRSSNSRTTLNGFPSSTHLGGSAARKRVLRSGDASVKPQHWLKINILIIE